MKIKSLDIIIPCYNPIGNWTKNIIDSATALNQQMDISFNYILVNDGSTITIKKEDIQLLKNKIDRFEYYSYDKNKGKGYAIRFGVQKSKHDNIVFTDIDFPYGTNAILEMVDALENGKDLVLALRNESYYNNISPSRKFISKVLKFTIKLFFRIPISDTQGGLKALSKKAKEHLLSTTIDRYLFDLELVKLCSKDHLDIIGIPCTLKPDIQLSSVGFSILKNEFSNFVKLLKM